MFFLAKCSNSHKIGPGCSTPLRMNIRHYLFHVWGRFKMLTLSSTPRKFYTRVQKDVIKCKHACRKALWSYIFVGMGQKCLMLLHMASKTCTPIYTYCKNNFKNTAWKLAHPPGGAQNLFHSPNCRWPLTSNVVSPPRTYHAKFMHRLKDYSY